MAVSRRFLQPRGWSKTANARMSRLAPAIVALGLTLALLIGAAFLFPPTMPKLPSATSILFQIMNVATLAFTQAPALVMVLTALFVVPLLAMTGLLVGTIMQQRRAVVTSAAAPTTTDAGARTAVTEPKSRAWIEITPDRLVALTGQRTRIGRHEDNEVHLTGPTVHRRHAMIEREADGGYAITDLSGSDGNGLLVNGERQARARLGNGDVIRLGDVELRFSMTPV